MKVAILAGGFGTRISEESVLKPKPMIEIGDKPILWHIMKQYSCYGITEFVILLGYKGYLIKEYFANYYLHECDVTIDTSNNSLEVHNNESEDWKVTLVNTGLNTMTGGRLKRAEKYLKDDTFMLTYGDGVSNINIDELKSFHKQHGSTLTLTSVQPNGRFGTVDFDNKNKVLRFSEKPRGDGAWVNGGFFVCEPEVFSYLKEGDKTVFELNPLDDIAKDGKLYTYKHEGFWSCMDTLRDKEKLNSMWEMGEAPWKIW